MRDDQWFDRDAGPVVRPYALTRGRTRPSGAAIDLLALVTAAGVSQFDLNMLEPEPRQLMRLARNPISVADLASELDLPLGVVRILLADMRERRLVTIRPPARTRPTDPQLLKDVADALRRL